MVACCDRTTPDHQEFWCEVRQEEECFRAEVEEVVTPDPETLLLFEETAVSFQWSVLRLGRYSAYYWLVLRLERYSAVCQ